MGDMTRTFEVVTVCDELGQHVCERRIQVHLHGGVVVLNGCEEPDHRFITIVDAPAKLHYRSRCTHTATRQLAHTLANSAVLTSDCSLQRAAVQRKTGKAIRLLFVNQILQEIKVSLS